MLAKALIRTKTHCHKLSSRYDGLPQSAHYNRRRGIAFFANQSMFLNKYCLSSPSYSVLPSDGGLSCVHKHKVVHTSYDVHEQQYCQMPDYIHSSVIAINNKVLSLRSQHSQNLSEDKCQPVNARIY